MQLRNYISFVTIETTDVQSAKVIFHQTYVQLSCRLTDVTQSLAGMPVLVLTEHGWDWRTKILFNVRRRRGRSYIVTM